MPGSFFYSLVRRWSDGDAIEAAAANRSDVRATLWPGAEPPAHPDHPRLAKSEASGIVGGRAMWVESRPLGSALSELASALTRAELARVLVDARAALETLHAAGHAHGSVRASRIVIGMDGAPTWIGVGQDRGTVDADLADFARLASSCGFGAIGEIEREAGAPVRRAVVEASVRQPDPNETIELGPGGVDEVEVDLGPDERGAGLLERWSEATSSGEPTGAPPANAPPTELPEVTIKASRAAIPFDRTIPRADAEPAPVGEVTVTEALSTSPFPWALVLAAIAMVVLALVLALAR